MFRLFVEGGVIGMGLLTIELILLLLAAWKAPAWVKEIGQLALVTCIIGFMNGFFQAGGALEAAGDVSVGLVFGGFKVMTISVIYGLMIYALSLIIRIIQKPRLL